MTSTTTESQQLFESFCSSSSVPIYPIPRSIKLGEQTPDYDIFISGYRVVVEVKQLEPNPEDQKYINRLQRTGSTGIISSQPGHRVRKAIDDAMP
jgi:hypothetical protein